MARMLWGFGRARRPGGRIHPLRLSSRNAKLTAGTKTAPEGAVEDAKIVCYFRGTIPGPLSQQPRW